MIIPLSDIRITPRSIIRIESLNRLFERNDNPHTYTYRGKCQTCGSSTNIEISKTSGGYGLLGGVLYETGLDNLIALCARCYDKYGKAEDRTVNSN